MRKMFEHKLQDALGSAHVTIEKKMHSHGDGLLFEDRYKRWVVGAAGMQGWTGWHGVWAFFFGTGDVHVCPRRLRHTDIQTRGLGWFWWGINGPEGRLPDTAGTIHPALPGLL